MYSGDSGIYGHVKNGGSRSDWCLLSVHVLIVISPVNSTGKCWIQILKDCLLILSDEEMPPCCSCGNHGRCQRCIFVKNRRPCSNCQPNKLGRCENQEEHHGSSHTSQVPPREGNDPRCTPYSGIRSRTTDFHHSHRSLSPSFAGVKPLMENSLLTVSD